MVLSLLQENILLHNARFHPVRAQGPALAATPASLSPPDQHQPPTSLAIPLHLARTGSKRQSFVMASLKPDGVPSMQSVSEAAGIEDTPPG